MHARTSMIAQLCFVLLTSGWCATAPADVVLVQDGRPKARIVVAKPALSPAEGDGAAQRVAAAAKDLQRYIELISGAKLEIVSDEAAASPAGGSSGASILV